MTLGYRATAATACQLAIIQGGTSAPLLSEVQELTAAAPYMPETMTVMIAVYKAYAIMLDTVPPSYTGFTMHFNDALLRGAAAMMPDVNGLLVIIGGCMWMILPAIPAKYIIRCHQIQHQ